MIPVRIKDSKEQNQMLLKTMKSFRDIIPNLHPVRQKLLLKTEGDKELLSVGWNGAYEKSII